MGNNQHCCENTNNPKKTYGIQFMELVVSLIDQMLSYPENIQHQHKLTTLRGIVLANKGTAFNQGLTTDHEIAKGFSKKVSFQASSEPSSLISQKDSSIFISMSNQCSLSNNVAELICADSEHKSQVYNTMLNKSTNLIEGNQSQIQQSYIMGNAEDQKRIEIIKKNLDNKNNIITWVMLKWVEEMNVDKKQMLEEIIYILPLLLTLMKYCYDKSILQDIRPDLRLQKIVVSKLFNEIKIYKTLYGKRRYNENDLFYQFLMYNSPIDKVLWLHDFIGKQDHNVKDMDGRIQLYSEIISKTAYREQIRIHLDIIELFRINGIFNFSQAEYFKLEVFYGKIQIE